MTKKIKIKKICVLSLGKILGVLYAFIGLIIGAIISLVSVIFHSGSSSFFEGLFGIGSIIFLPVFYGVLGFLGGLISAALYNIVASWMGGLEIEV
ncbi:hypothetical protein COV16_05560 [Candidatus Woesearchaeota archaeon CG10_big_fil_rev_8_21_14_0_10_34_8]|nr:MAG: hypothetical protein COV16_05560 [Candidatus Woesearchaeota archaeon CG10_big_fil_rev_8_21_14_0_10_34_8]